MGTRERSDAYILMEKFEPQLTVDYKNLSYFDILSDDEKCIRCYALPRIFNSDLCVECEDVMEQTDHPAVEACEHLDNIGSHETVTIRECTHCHIIEIEATNFRGYINQLAKQEDNSG